MFNLPVTNAAISASASYAGGIAAKEALEGSRDSLHGDNGEQRSYQTIIGKLPEKVIAGVLNAKTDDRIYVTGDRRVGNFEPDIVEHNLGLVDVFIKACSEKYVTWRGVGALPVLCYEGELETSFLIAKKEMSMSFRKGAYILVTADLMHDVCVIGVCSWLALKRNLGIPKSPTVQGHKHAVYISKLEKNPEFFPCDNLEDMIVLLRNWSLITKQSPF